MGQALYRKYRSKTLDEIVGQDHITKTLAQAVKNGRISHAYLFTGPKGVGKTSIARILAHEVNGLPYQHEDNHIDIIEIDAASNRGIDEIRDLRDKVYMAPVATKYKVYIIDEVHMLTTQAFNALLKTLEEPPEHVKFLLATTDPQKLPVTVLSRCLQFNLRRLEIGQIQGRLQQIMLAEKISAEDAALHILSKAADGSLRDALSLLDQAIVHGGGEVRREGVLGMLGRSGDDTVMLMIAALIAQDAERVFALVNEHLARGLDAAGLLDLIIEGTHRLSLAQFVPGVAEGDDAELISQLRNKINPLVLQSWYALLLSARRDFQLYPDQRMALEMAFLRVLSFSTGNIPPSALSPEPGKKPSSISQTSTETAITTVETVQPVLPELIPESRTFADVVREPAPEILRENVFIPPQAVHMSLSWQELIATLSLSPLLQEQLRHGQALQCDAQKVDLLVEPRYLPFIIKEKARILKALSDHFGQTPQLVISELTEASGVRSVNAEAESQASARQEEAQVRVANDPLIKQFTEILGTQVESITLMTLTNQQGGSR